MFILAAVYALYVIAPSSINEVGRYATMELCKRAAGERLDKDEFCRKTRDDDLNPWSK